MRRVTAVVTNGSMCQLCDKQSASAPPCSQAKFMCNVHVHAFLHERIRQPFASISSGSISSSVIDFESGCPAQSVLVCDTQQQRSSLSRACVVLMQSLPGTAPVVQLAGRLLQVSMSRQREPLPGPAAKLPLLDLRKVEQSHQHQQVEALRRLQCLVQRLQAHINLAWSRFLCLIGCSSTL